MISTALLLMSMALAEIPTNFRGIEFGSACSTNTRLVHDEAHDDGKGGYILQAYRQTDGELRIGTIALTDLAYICWNDQLMMVSIGFSSSDGNTMLNALSKNWGEPFQDNRFIDKYLWSGTIFGALAYGSYRPGSLTIAHGSMMRRWTAVIERERAEEAAHDL